MTDIENMDFKVPENVEVKCEPSENIEIDEQRPSQDFEFVAVKEERPDEEEIPHQIAYELGGSNTCGEGKNEEYILGLEPNEDWNNIKENLPSTTWLQHQSYNVSRTQTCEIVGYQNESGTEISESQRSTNYNHSRKNAICKPAKEVNECGGFTCNSCFLVFPSKYYLTKHVFTHIEGLQSPCHICQHCAEVFSTKVEFNEHVLVSCANVDSVLVKSGVCKNSTQEFSSHTCETRRKHFKNSKSLTQSNSIHTRQKSYFCEVCGKGFGSGSNLKVHKLIHTDILPFKCETCGKCFRESGSLLKHSRIHTGDKPYSCDVCDKRFTQSSHLCSHRRRHFSENSFICDTCGKSFSKRKMLISHCHAHIEERPFICKVCGSAFSRKASLNRHELIHTGELPYKCKICGRGFNVPENLQRHNRVHTGEKPFSCKECGKCFSALHNLQRHKKLHLD